MVHIRIIKILFALVIVYIIFQQGKWGFLALDYTDLPSLVRTSICDICAGIGYLAAGWLIVSGLRKDNRPKKETVCTDCEAKYRFRGW